MFFAQNPHQRFAQCVAAVALVTGPAYAALILYLLQLPARDFAHLAPPWCLGSVAVAPLAWFGFTRLPAMTKWQAALVSAALVALARLFVAFWLAIADGSPLVTLAFFAQSFAFPWTGFILPEVIAACLTALIHWRVFAVRPSTEQA